MTLANAKSSILKQGSGNVLILGIQFFGGRGSSSGKGGKSAKPAAKAPQPAPQPTPHAQPAPVQQAQPSNAPVNYTKYTDADAQAFRNQYADVFDDPDVSMAHKLYISDSNPNGDGFSHSQNLNYKLDNGLPLNATEKFMDDNLHFAMSPLGKDAKFVRFAHDDILKQFGVSDYTKMSETQLQKALIGKSRKTTSYMSASYDESKSPFAPNAALGGGREVKLNINSQKSTRAMLGARKQTETIFDKDTNVTITGIRFDGSYATPRGSSKRKPRVVIDIETS